MRMRYDTDRKRLWVPKLHCTRKFFCMIVGCSQISDGKQDNIHPDSTTENFYSLSLTEKPENHLCTTTNGNNIQGEPCVKLLQIAKVSDLD